MGGWLLAFCLVTALRSFAGTNDSGNTVQAGAEAQKHLSFDVAELEGPDPKVAELAAHRLLQAVAARDEKAEASRVAHLNFLLERVEAGRIAQASTEIVRSNEIVCATRIIDALATWTTSGGPPFPQVSEVVQPLLGVGPASFRTAVKRALKALVLHELKSARRMDTQAAGAGSATLAALAARFLESPSPPEAFVRDASLIFWEADGKGLLGTLLGALQLHAGSAPGMPGALMASTCFDELQARVGLSFPTVDGWQKWWAEVREWSLEHILADAQRRSREEYVVLWRQMLRRLRETGDSERLFLAIQDTIDGMNVLELRLAAVAALGDFAEWMTNLPPGPNSNGAGADPRGRLLARGAERLCALSESRSVPGERPEVLRASLVSLRKYHAFLGRSPALLQKVSRIVAERIHELSLEGKPRVPEDLVETLRIAGVLRVAQAQSFVAMLLDERGSTQEMDIELTTVAITCLGRLLEEGVSPEGAALVLGQFRKPRSSPEKAVKELRRACLSALGSGSENPQVRADLRMFFKDSLWGPGGGAIGVPPRGDKDLRIPSILGLGTLARQRDSGAFEALTEVLKRQDQFESQEVAAALDSLSYLGGRSVVTMLCRCLTDAKDKGVEDHARKKLLSLVESTGGFALAWALEDLESFALAEESLVPIEQVFALVESPQAKAWISMEKVDTTKAGRVEWLARALLALARAADLLDRDEVITETLNSLGDLLLKAPEAREALGDVSMSLAAFKTSLSLRSALRARFSKSDLQDSLATLKELEALLAADPGLLGRWRNLRWTIRQFSEAPASERIERIRSSWHAFLSSDSSRPLWQDFPPRLRERILGKLESLGPGQ